MVPRPAARITDLTLHLLPGMLTPGPPSANVMIGGLFAWKGAPGGAGASLKDDKIASQKRILKATAACALAGNTPQAKAALEALKIKEAAEMQKKIMDAASSGASINACISVVPVPVGVPHGPGLVINGSPTVLINNLPACRLGDEILESFGPKDFIIWGQLNVLIGNRPMLTLAQMIANAIANLKKVITAAANLAQFLLDIVGKGVSTAVNLALQTLGRVQNVARKVIDLLGLSGAAAKVREIVGAVREEVNGVIDGAITTIAAAAEDPVGTIGEITSDVAKGIKKAAEAFQEGLQDAVEEEKAKLRRMEENARKMYDKGSKTIDELAEQDGPVGDLGKELQQRRDNLERKKDNIEKRAEQAAEAAQEGLDKARELKKEAKEKIQETRKAAEDTAKETARKIGELAQGLADGLDDTPELPHDHDHADAGH